MTTAEYNAEMDKIIYQKLDVPDTLIALLDRASQIKIYDGRKNNKTSRPRKPRKPTR